MLLGTIVSVLCWLRSYTFDAPHVQQVAKLIVIVVAVKVIAGGVMLVRNGRSRGFGTGLLLSILPGFLVFVIGFLVSVIFGVATIFSNCAASMQYPNGRPGSTTEASIPAVRPEEEPPSTMPSTTQSTTQPIISP